MQPESEADENRQDHVPGARPAGGAARGAVQPPGGASDPPWTRLWPAPGPLGSILDQTFGFLGLLALDGTLLDVNQPALDAGGFRREDVIGRPFWETGWWNRDAAVQASLREAIARAARGCSVRDEAVYFTAEGSRRVVDRSVLPVRDDRGRIRYVMAEGRDVTERKCLESALQASEERFRQVFHLSPAALCITRATDGRLIEVNEAFLSLAGTTREAMIGRTEEELGWWTDGPERANVLRRLERQGSLRDITLGVRIRAGDVRTVVASVERLALGGEACLLSAFVDVTERERLLLLEERERIGAELHDATVQSLYSAVLRLTAAERLLQNEGGAADRTAGLLRRQLGETREQLIETIQTTRNIVRDLAVTRLGQRGFRCGLAAVADDLERDTGAAVRMVVESEAERLLDEEAAGTLLLLAREAASNVARHAAASVVKFKLAHDGDGLRFVVRDNGRGFAAECPVEPCDAPPVPGGGDTESRLRGLETMARRAKRLGGRLTVTSAPGEGTTIRVTIPHSSRTGRPS